MTANNQDKNGVTSNSTAIDALLGYYVNGDQVVDENGIWVGPTLTNAKMAVPKMGVIQQTVLYSAFTDGGGAVGTLELDTDIPVGAIVTQATIDDLTGFTGDTSAVLTIGDGTGVDRYNTGTPDIFTTADVISAGAPSGTALHAAAKTPTLTVTSAAAFADVVAGEMTVTIFYYQPV